NQRPGADLALSRLPFVFQILRCEADRAEWIQLRVFADARVPLDHDVRQQLGAGLDDHMRANGAERTNLNAWAEFRAMRNDRSRMNAGTIKQILAALRHQVHSVQVPSIG